MAYPPGTLSGVAKNSSSAQSVFKSHITDGLWKTQCIFLVNAIYVPWDASLKDERGPEAEQLEDGEGRKAALAFSRPWPSALDYIETVLPLCKV